MVGAALGFEALFFGSHGVRYFVNRVESNKVNTALDFYGGIDRYLCDAFFGTYIKFCPFDTKNIKVGIDEKVPEGTKKQVVYCLDYINDMFSVINPNYRFNAIDANTVKSCDIYVGYEDLVKKYDDSYRQTMAVTVNRKPRDIFNYVDYSKAEILFNHGWTDGSCYDRMTFLHEMMHVMLLNEDLTSNENEAYNHKTVPYSLLSYKHVNEVMFYLDGCYDYTDITENDKNTFVSYTPFDLAAFASRYGNIDSEENRIACVKLIVDSYKKYEKLFGEKNYFLSDELLNKQGYPYRFDIVMEKENKNNKTTTNSIKKVEEDEMTL